jgi:ABC-type sugar transport system permease subunit
MSGKSVVLRSPARRVLDAAEPGLWRRYALAFGFLLPALFLLGVWIVYPTLRTIVRSFFSDSGDGLSGSTTTGSCSPATSS